MNAEMKMGFMVGLGVLGAIIVASLFLGVFKK